MRVAIMGSGGLGSLFGGLLTRAGLDVTFIARGANLESLREGGLSVQLAHEQFHTSVRATDNLAEVGVVDVVWLCVKTYDIDEAARQILPLIGPDTIVLPIQNGVGIAESIAAVVGAEHVVGAVAPGCQCELNPSGASHHEGTPVPGGSWRTRWRN
jgi:2-dehydropantoate 2-reductase